MEGAGIRLKKIRLQKGLSLDDVQKGTKIHLNILQSIEEDSFINVSPIYIKGFIKIYCKFLDVDFKEYLPDYKESPRSVYLPEEKPRGPAPSAKEVANLRLSSAGSSGKLKRIAGIILAVVLLVIFIFMVRLVFHRVGSLISKAGKKRPSSRVVQKRAPVSAPKRSFSIIPLPKPKEAEVSGAKAISGSGIRMGIHIKEDCFVELKIDGRLILKSILKKDTFESWVAKEKIELSLGNAGGVNLEVNGEALPSLGKRGFVLRNILITKEGVKIPR